MVFQDGKAYVNGSTFNALDNLIHRRDIPVMIGVFVNPGVVPPQNENAQTRFNRSLEYDDMSDRYSQFLIDELLPHIERAHGVQFSIDPNLRGITGASSGAICAFNVAWHRPDSFHRVYSTIGTYVGLRGGDEIPTLIRKTEPKPLRIFLQDGENDLNIYGGDWWIANQMMQRALKFSGYELKHEWGDGGHSRKHGNAIFPDAMRWLWHSDAAEVKTHYDQCRNEAVRFLESGEDWQLLSDGHGWAEGLAAMPDGTVYFTDVPASKIYRIGTDDKVELFAENTGRANGLRLGPDGLLYGAANGAGQIASWDPKTAKRSVVAEGVKCNDLVVRHDGTVYFTNPADNKIMMIRKGSGRAVVVDNFRNPNGLTLSADQTMLFVGHFPGRFIYSYTINDDGTLANKQEYYYMHVPSNSLEGHLDGMCVSRDGWLVAATELGVQICVQPGRMHLILPKPRLAKRVSYTAFGGKDWKTLYIATGNRVYKRRTKLTGAQPWRAPIKPPRPRL
jgi:sugar lactone lactonase YvrE/predicted alpha/beta superfamily hydrolase